MTYTAEGGQRGGLTYTGNYAQEGRIYRGGDGYSGGGGGFYRRETLSSSRNADNTDADEDTFEDAECESLHGDKLRSGNGVIEGRWSEGPLGLVALWGLDSAPPPLTRFPRGGDGLNYVVLRTISSEEL